MVVIFERASNIRAEILLSNALISLYCGISRKSNWNMIMRAVIKRANAKNPIYKLKKRRIVVVPIAFIRTSTTLKEWVENLYKPSVALFTLSMVSPLSRSRAKKVRVQAPLKADVADNFVRFEKQ
jgi:hypothetical protein